MRPDIRIFKDLEELSVSAADLFTTQAGKSIQERDRFLVALNGGNTPVSLFKLLATDFRRRVEWSKVHVFWGDERLVPANDPGSSYGQAWDAFLRHVPILETHVHRVKTELPPAEATMDYALTLKQFASPPLDWPRFDLIYLGMGDDGHTASLFPGSPLDVTGPVIPVTASYEDRPSGRISMTPLVFNSARKIVFMASGAKKAATLAEVLSDRFDPELYPAQRVEPKDGKLIWLVDEDAAGRLPTSLIRRFCEG